MVSLASSIGFFFFEPLLFLLWLFGLVRCFILRLLLLLCFSSCCFFLCFRSCFFFCFLSSCFCFCLLPLFLSFHVVLGYDNLCWPQQTAFKHITFLAEHHYCVVWIILCWHHCYGFLCFEIELCSLDLLTDNLHTHILKGLHDVLDQPFVFIVDLFLAFVLGFNRIRCSVHIVQHWEQTLEQFTFRFLDFHFYSPLVTSLFRLKFVTQGCKLFKRLLLLHHSLEFF
mmetsp:Transcript_67978/g.107804  ORF Transcript_67978/g.107804 Transcript_67978/m.107804 type:complete len:226 (+) Transcript_67978:193-870(+)